VVAVSLWKVTAERGKRAWTLEQPELGAVSQCLSLDQARDEMAEAIAWLSGEPETEVEVEVEVVLSDGSRAAVGRVDAAREGLESAKAELARAARDAAQALTGAGLTYRDAASVLGLSHQRVAQLLKVKPASHS
jgi:DNA-directed RNA polymerase specialized sigma24 family protein